MELTGLESNTETAHKLMMASYQNGLSIYGQVMKHEQAKEDVATALLETCECVHCARCADMRAELVRESDNAHYHATKLRRILDIVDQRTAELDNLYARLDALDHAEELEEDS